MHYLARSKSRLKIVCSVNRTVSQFCLHYLFEERCMYCSIDKIEVIHLVFYVVNNYCDIPRFSFGGAPNPIFCVPSQLVS